MTSRQLRTQDIMSTALITASADDSIAVAERGMNHAGIRHVLVVDDRHHLVGVVSDRDVLRELHRLEAEVVALRAIMTTEVETIAEDAPASEAVAILMERKIGCLPVVGAEGQLVGIVTETDFLQVAHSALVGGAVTHRVE